MKARKLWRRYAKKDRNRSAIAKKGWETRRANADAAPPVWKSRDPDHAPFHVPPDTVAKAYPEGFNWSVDFHQLEPGSLSAEAYARERGLGTAVEQELLAGLSDEDTAELDASNLTYRGDGGAGLRGGDVDDYLFEKPGLGPSVTLIKVNGTEEMVELSPLGEGLKPDQDEVDRLKRRSEVINEMRAARNQVPLGPVRDRLEDELDAYKERIEKERAQERLQSQEAHAAALRATVERVLVQGFMGDMRGNADFKTQASHWLMNMDQAEAVFAALQRAGY